MQLMLRMRRQALANTVTVEGVEYDELAILTLKGWLNEHAGHRTQNVADFCKVFNALQDFKIELDAPLQYRLSRLAGTTLLEAAYILRSLDRVKNVPGDWCEYGVAQGKTSALLAQVMLRESGKRMLWLYDSFEGLPRPHEKDILLNDIFRKQTMEAYEGTISIPERCVWAELESVTRDLSRFRVTKGWITLELLKEYSPEKIAFAYLDMDLYQSTYDVLNFLIERMPKGGIVVIDDYGFFSEGVKTAVTEIGAKYPGAFSLEHPFGDKFVVLKRQ